MAAAARLARTVIESLAMETDAGGELLVVAVRPRRGAQRRCGRCGVRAPWYDRGPGRRRWRHLDFGTVRVMLEAEVPRVNCPRHGPSVMAVPWARHASRFTTAFEDTAAWLTARAAASTVGVLMRTTWRAVTGIVERVVTEAAGRTDRLAGLRRVGIDEAAYRKGQRYLTVVVDHDTGRLVWAGKARDKATVAAFFDTLGPQRPAQLTHVSADPPSGSMPWWPSVPRRRSAADPYHLVAWATDALDKGTPAGVEHRTGRGWWA
jgi:transposase